MKKTKVEVTADGTAYPHDGLDAAAHYFNRRVKERADANDRDGLGFEMMACLVLLAFTVEAQFNFLGHKLITDWNERDTALDKVHTVLKKLNSDNDLTKAPYKTIKELKELRDLLAHAKPEELAYTHVVELTKEERDALMWPACEYETYLKEAFVAESYDNVDSIWKELLEKADIKPEDLLSRKTTSMRPLPETG